MNKLISTAAILAASTSMASAIGLDRSNQNVGVIFEEGDYVEFSFGTVRPSLDGNDAEAFGGSASGNVADNYFQYGFGYHQQINDQLSFSLILDQPFGADIDYPEGNSLTLGGTKATLDSTALSGIGRYKFDENYSVHGGLRVQRLKGNITLNGGGYGPLAGYNVDLGSNTSYGYLFGAAYERPEIALRVALTYFSKITHDFPTTENITPAGGPDTEVETPQAINLDFQSGVAEDTLVFGQIRWADYDNVTVAPFAFNAATPPGTSLTNIDTNYGLTLGVGRRFSDQFSGAISVNFEKGTGDDVSPLSPSDGRLGLTVGGAYTIGDVEISGGINYTRLGDATPTVGGNGLGRFEGNSAVGVGIKVGYSF